MATYLYENANGEQREIVASMKNPPPEVVHFRPDGSFIDAHCVQWHSFDKDERPGDIFRRVYTNPAVQISRGAAVAHVGQDIPQASRSLPPTHEQGEIVNRFGTSVRRLASGHYATMDGRRIVDSAKARDAHLKETGCVSDD